MGDRPQRIHLALKNDQLVELVSRIGFNFFWRAEDGGRDNRVRQRRHVPQRPRSKLASVTARISKNDKISSNIFQWVFELI